MRKTIVVLSSDDSHHLYLASMLRARFHVAAHVVEPRSDARARVLRARRYIDYGYGLYHRMRRTVLGLDDYRAGYFAEPPRPRAGDECREITVEWVNDPAVIELLREIRPDITVVASTSILRKELLAVGGTIINVHAGCLPDYRGHHGVFFALYNDELDKVGATLHFVDPGIDTGDILEVVTPPIHPDDDEESLSCRAEMLAFERLAFWIEQVERGATLPRTPQGARNRLVRMRDRKPHHDLLLWARGKMWTFRSPEEPVVKAPHGVNGVSLEGTHLAPRA